MSRQALKNHLVSSGLCEDSAAAEALVMAGKVLVNEQPAKAGQEVKPEDQVRLRESACPYASKGGLKLEGALRVFQIQVQGRVCLDAGASTGGFTDCLLKHGAGRVYAVDTGFGQLTGALRQEKRVVNLERTNLSDPSLMDLDPTPDLATCDLSYLSLRRAVPVYRDILHGNGEVIALVKPLFEVDSPEVRRSGVIPDSAYLPMLMDLIHYLNGLRGLAVMDICASPVTGSAGTIEFFLHILAGEGRKAADLQDKVISSVRQGLETGNFKKWAK